MRNRGHFSIHPFVPVGLLLSMGLVCLLPLMAMASNITAIWANDGEDKVSQDDLRATNGNAVTNSVWDGKTISVFGGKNEVISFNVILEAGQHTTGNMAVSLQNLNGPNSSTLSSPNVTGDGVFSWIQRPIELFLVRYLQINGISVVSNDTFDERHIPQRLRRPWTGNGVGSGTWQDRPDHNKAYPEIAVPLELVQNFTINSGNNQSIWVDIYIPKTAQPGTYQGVFQVQENGSVVQNIPVKLKVYDFTLPDLPSAKTMLYLSATDINRRFFGTNYIASNSAQSAQAQLLRDRYFQMAHRHKISMIGDDTANNCNSTADQPCPEWIPRLNGNLFTAANGYDGPGVGVGNNVYAVGTYGSWSWQTGDENAMHQHADAWVNWFNTNVSGTEYFLYLDDESTNYAQTQTWAQWILSDPGPGRNLKSMATIPLDAAAAQTPALDIPTTTMGYGNASQWQPLADRYTNDARKRFFMYNGHRPASGSFATEDDGVALRELAWGQYKKHIQRWYYWNASYYNNYQGGMGDTSLFTNAQTFGTNSSVSTVLGQTGWNYGNGDGVLMYPGTDVVFPASSYGVNGPIASLRLKYWRRGIQDVDYLTMAAALDPSGVQSLVNSMVPKVLWEYGVADPNDPTYQYSDISWSTDPNQWEAARLQLAKILDGKTGSGTGGLPTPTLNLPPFLPLNATLNAGYPGGYNNVTFQWTITPTAAPTNASAAIASSTSTASTINFQTPTNNASLTGYSLSPGYYSVTVRTADNAGNMSQQAQSYVTFVVTNPAAGSRVYPNPWRSDKHAGHPITFDNLYPDSTIKIFTVSGFLVKTLQAPAGIMTWDLTNESGSQVASGLYLYVITSDQASKITGKLAIIK